MPRLTVEELRPGDGDTLLVFAGAGGSTDELLTVVGAIAVDLRVVAVAVVGDPGAGDTVEGMAAEAVELVRAEQPQGPYRLLGYSFGGLIALEAAQLLTDAGETVTFTGMVDSFFDQRHWPTALFARATARRTALHLRGVVGQPPGQALRELSARSGRLARRLRGRRGAAAPGAGAAATVQDANVAVMAQWTPRVVDLPVTLFTATEADFGCDLGDLWRPWLPQLTVRRVWGNHLDLTQTSEGAQRLARAVSRAVGSSPSSLTVLVASTFRWAGAARLAVALDEIGCIVDGVAPQGNALHSVTAVRRCHRLGLASPVRSLRRAIEVSAPDLVIPFDDRTRHALTVLCGSSDATSESGARLLALLERSLGAGDKLAHAYSRAGVLTTARNAGVLSPPTELVASTRDLTDWFARHPGPAVLKTDGSWGGRGTVIVNHEADALKAYRQLRRRTPVARAVKRLVVERDPWPLRARFEEPRPVVSIQSYVAGRPGNAAIACYQGTALAAIQAEVVESDGPTGPSTVLRVVDNADMTYAAKAVVGALRLSGLCGLDFVVDDAGRAHLIELNPRATPTSHLVGVDGSDPLTALRAAFGQERPAARPAPYHDGLVALFPQHLEHPSSGTESRRAHLDVPTDAPDFVALALAGLRKRRASVPSDPVSDLLSTKNP